jgi:hypothetical protein
MEKEGVVFGLPENGGMTVPTNLDYIIAALTDQIDDGGASFESVVHYYISCPHYSDETGLPCDYAEISRDVCVRCKMEWLEKEYDT